MSGISKTLSVAKQESVLTVLCFFKEEALILLNVIEPELFSNLMYRDIASKAIDYLTVYKDVVGPHLVEVFEDILEGSDSKKADLYDDVLHNLNTTTDSVNPEFVLSSIQSFIRKQSLKSAVVEAAEYLQQDDIDGVENVLEKARNTQIKVFQPGLILSENPQAFINSYLSVPESVPCGISYFDSIGLGPTKGEVLTILAAPNKGKSWGLIHFSKHALMNRKKVLHISLEMSEPRVAQRYLQSILSISKRKVEVNAPYFDVDDKGQFLDLSFCKLNERPSLADDGIERIIFDKLDRVKNRLNIVVKQFPTSGLTSSGLENYLDMLERQHDFIPDILALDYLDLMSVDSNNLRESLGALLKKIRGIGVERDIGILTVSQSNRSGEEVRIMNLKHLGEDYSKAATSDIIISYNQTHFERSLNLARLFVAKMRNDEAGATVLISQAYPIGQFALESALMNTEYWNILDNMQDNG